MCQNWTFKNNFQWQESSESYFYNDFPFFVFYRVFSDFNSGKMPTSTLFLKIKMNGKWEKSRMKTVEKKECIYFMTANHSLERYEMSFF